MPDTPRWYYARGRIEEGDAILARLHELPADHKTVTNMSKTILETIEEEKRNKFDVWTLFWDNTEAQVGRRLRTSFLILFVQQLLGINMLVYYRYGKHLRPNINLTNSLMCSARKSFLTLDMSKIWPQFLPLL